MNPPQLRGNRKYLEFQQVSSRWQELLPASRQICRAGSAA